jgi:hypothetical protein
MTRAPVADTTTPCANRSELECTTGCVLDACVGELGCASESELGSCVPRAGCRWAPNQCAGNARPACKLADYDVVSGGKFATGALAALARASVSGLLPAGPERHRAPRSLPFRALAYPKFQRG